MSERRIRLYQVEERLPRPELALASLSYLRLRYLEDATPDKASGRLPYGADAGSRCLFYSIHDDPAALFRHPFLYQEQFNTVQTLLAVPFEQLDGMDQAPRPPAVFVFSIGRCGSTLLARMLTAAGLTAISEPDIFTQMARPEARRFSLPERRKYLAAAIRCLAAYAPGTVVIKLRSDCNIIAPLIVGCVPGSRCEFVLRNRRDWAKSMAAAGRDDPVQLARQLANAVMALDKLIELGYCTGPIWYEDVVRQPGEVLRRFPAGLAADGNAALEKAIAEDSQSGTLLSRERLAQRPVPDEMLNRFEDEWRKIRPEHLLTKHGLKDRL